MTKATEPEQLDLFNNVPTEGDLQYLAGYFDGEGHVSVIGKKRGDPPRLNRYLSIHCCDYEILLKFRRLLGGRISDRMLHKNVNHSDSWQWRIHSKEAERVVRLLLPYATCPRKRRKMIMLITTGRRRGGQSEADQNRRDRIYRILVNKGPRGIRHDKTGIRSGD